MGRSWVHIREPKLLLTAAAAAVTVGLLVGLAFPYTDMALLVVLLGGLVVVLKARLPPTPLSAVYFAVALWMLAALSGTVLHLAAPPSVPRRNDLNDAGLVGSTSALYLAAAAALLAGAFLYMVVTDRRYGPESKARLSGIELPESAQSVLLVLCIVPLLLIIVGATHGIETLLHRSEYIQDRAKYSQLFGLGSILTVAATLLAGHLWVSGRSPSRRLAALGVALVYALVNFSLASRTLTLLPLGFAVGAYSAAPTSRTSRTLLIGGVGLGIVLLALPLYLRTSAEHGLLPYLRTLAGDDPSAVVPPWGDVLSNVVGTFDITAETAFLEPPLQHSHLWPSLSPLPGALAGWYEIEPLHRLDAATPYSAIGELRNYGMPALLMYFLVAGCVLGSLESRTRELLENGHQLRAIVLTGVAALFPILALQYPLRSVTRILYYGAAVMFLDALSTKTRRHGRREPQEALGSQMHSAR